MQPAFVFDNIGIMSDERASKRDFSNALMSPAHLSRETDELIILIRSPLFNKLCLSAAYCHVNGQI